MIRSLIIDDVEKARVALKSDLADYCPQIQVTGEADGVESGLRMISETSPQLIFLDIRMGDGSGFDLLERLQDKKVQVIFTTAYDEYAIKAFKFSAVDYLLKPVDPEDLIAAVKKVSEHTESPAPFPLEVLMQNLKKIKDPDKKIALASSDKIIVVSLKDVVRCEAHGNYTLFFLSDKRQILVTRTMKDYEEMLEEYDFLRVHHSHLINLNFLKEYVKIDGTYAVMADGAEVPVSVRKRDRLLGRLGNL